MDELGRGAFGKVHRGALKELPTVEIFDKPRDQRVEIKEAKVVAIKTLLGEQKDIYSTELAWVPYWPALLYNTEYYVLVKSNWWSIINAAF